MTGKSEQTHRSRAWRRTLVLLATTLTATLAAPLGLPGVLPVAQAGFAGDNGRLVVSDIRVDDNGNYEGIGLSTVASDGTDYRPLTAPFQGSEDSDAVYGPNGQTVAFYRSSADGNTALMVRDTFNNAFPLTEPDRSLFRFNPPTFSADGAKIVFSRFDLNEFRVELHTIASDGTSNKVSTEVRGAANTDMVTPTVATNGAVAWVEQTRDQNGPTGSSLWAASDLTFADAHRVTDVLPGHVDLHPDFSPDGDRIAFVTEEGLFTTDLSGNVVGPVLNVEPLPAPLSWSPKGDKVVYFAADEDCVAVCVNTVDIATSTDRLFLLLSGEVAGHALPLGVDWGRTDPPAGPTATTGALTGADIQTNSAALVGTFNRRGGTQPVYAGFVYGRLDVGLNQRTATQRIDQATGDVTVRIPAVGLNRGTAHGFRAVLTDAAGNQLAVGDQRDFTTDGTPPSNSLPFLVGTNAIGGILECAPGFYDGANSYEYAFFKVVSNGITPLDSGSPTYFVQASDASSTIGCRANAVTSGGVIERTSSNRTTIVAGRAGTIPTLKTAMPNLLRGTTACAGTTRKTFCEAEDVRTRLTNLGFSFDLDVIEVGINAVPANVRDKVTPGEVVAQTPTAGQLVESGPTKRLAVTLNVYDPPPPPEKICDLAQKTTDGARVFTLSQALVGASYEKAMDVLTEYGCRTLDADGNETSTRYEIVNTPTKGLLAPIVKSVSTDTALKFVKLNLGVPKSDLVLTPIAAKTPGALTFGLRPTPPINGVPQPASIDLNVAAAQNNEFVVRAGMPNGLRVRNLELVLRDPRGLEIASAITGEDGIATFSAPITRPGRHTVTTVLSDAYDDDVLYGYADMKAVDPKGKPFTTLTGSSLVFSGGRWTPATSAGARMAAAAAVDPSLADLRALAGAIRDNLPRSAAQERLRFEYRCALQNNAMTLWEFSQGSSLAQAAEFGMRIEINKLGGSGGLKLTPAVGATSQTVTAGPGGIKTLAASSYKPKAAGSATFHFDATDRCAGVTFTPGGGYTFDVTIGRTGLVDTPTATIDASSLAIHEQRLVDNANRLIGVVSLIGMDGATLIGADGATLVGPDGATLVGPDGATFTAGRIVAAGAGNIVAAGAGNIVAAGAGN